jgi:hypothetical protein
MKIDDNPPGLIGRRMLRVGDGKVVVQEEWNIDTPGCPMIRSPWHPPPPNSGPLWIRQVTMTEEEYRDAFPNA